MSTHTLHPLDPGGSNAPTGGVAREVTAPRAEASGHPGTLLTLRLLAAAALVVSAYVHLVLALENGLGGPLFTMPQLFLGQAVAAAVAGGLLLVGDRRLLWVPALVVAFGSTVPILASVYFPLPGIGPLPPINEPVWYGEKLLSLAVGLTVPLLWLIRSIAPPAR